MKKLELRILLVRYELGEGYVWYPKKAPYRVDHCVLTRDKEGRPYWDHSGCYWAYLAADEVLEQLKSKLAKNFTHILFLKKYETVQFTTHSVYFEDSHLRKLIHVED